jgi:tRNA (mo5U34)-methyltransferase
VNVFRRRRRGPRSLEPDEIRKLVDSVPFWLHSIDLGHGIVTPGSESLESLVAKWDALRVPDLHGKTVLDIGSWDGFYAFEAERRGGSRVVALDHYVWSLDLAGQQAYWRRCRDEEATPQPYHETPFWQPATLPGKRGFDVAQRCANSSVEAVADDYMTTDAALLGVFDVVLYLGVLYHMEDPLSAMRRVSMLTKELAIVETEAIAVAGFDDAPLFEFYPAAELNDDVGNWWAPNLAGVHALCRAAGFSHVETVHVGPAAVATPGKPGHFRAIVHARKG